MKILDLYIGKIIAATTFFTLIVLTGLSGIIKFVEQMKSVGKGDYDLAHASLFVLFSVPRDIEIFFPMAALIGGLIGLGSLASNSELVVMQSAGLSKLDIIKSVMKSAFVLVLATMAVGEWVSPRGEAAAREIRAQAISGGSLISAKHGIWAKDGDLFVHIGEVANTGTLNNLQIFKFNEQLKLTEWTGAQQATYTGDYWQLTGVETTKIGQQQITRARSNYQQWVSSLTPEKLGVVTVKPESLSISGLLNYLDYLKANQQDQSRYLLAFWRKLIQPLTVAVMLLVALSYIFGPLRSVSMGARIVMGIVTGIVFMLVNQAFGSVSLVYQLPVFLGATLPSLLFIAISVYLIKRRQ